MISSPHWQTNKLSLQKFSSDSTAAPVQKMAADRRSRDVTRP